MNITYNQPLIGWFDKIYRRGSLYIQADINNEKKELEKRRRKIFYFFENRSLFYTERKKIGELYTFSEYIIRNAGIPTDYTVGILDFCLIRKMADRL